MRVLCTCLPGYGHFLPMLAFARAAVAAGHTVAFATAADFCPQVQRAGFVAHPAGVSMRDQLAQAAARYPEQHAMPYGKERFTAFVPRMLAGVAAPPRAADVAAVIEQWQPDVVVHEETEFGGPVAAAAAGVPYADHSVGFLRPLAMARLAGETIAPLADAYGVDLGEFAGLFRYLYLDVCPPSLQVADIDRIATAHPMRNTDLPAADEELPGWVADLPDRPTVYVSLGTIFNTNPQVFATILEGLGDEPVNVIVTVGGDADPAALGTQPDHIHIERFIPQQALLPHCDAVVNQGGTAILPILAHALPLLVLPQGANQFHQAELCVAAGVGRSRQPGEVTAAGVRADLRALLDAPAYRQRCAEVAGEIAALPDPDDGVARVARLAADPRPQPRAAAQP